MESVMLSKCTFIYSFINHLLIHSFIHSFIHSLIHSFIHSIIYNGLFFKRRCMATITIKAELHILYSIMYPVTDLGGSVTGARPL